MLYVRIERCGSAVGACFRRSCLLLSGRKFVKPLAAFALVVAIASRARAMSGFRGHPKAEPLLYLDPRTIIVASVCKMHGMAGKSLQFERRFLNGLR